MSTVFPTAALAAVQWDPVIPPIAIFGLGGLLILVSVWTYLRVILHLSLPRRMGLLILRVAAILAICLFLFQPSSEEIIPRKHANRVATVLIDTSRSMDEKDAADQSSRLDAARALLLESGLLGEDSPVGKVELHRFDSQPEPLAPSELPAITTRGDTTRIYSAVSNVLEEMNDTENSVGLFLLTDGHDFERTPAERVAAFAQARKTPIYPIAFGKQQTIPDISLELTSYRPYTFVQQNMRIDAAVRMVGGSPRPLRIELLREGVAIGERKISATPGGESNVTFSVSEEEAGQFEYTVRASPLPDERELGNNEVSTFVNVTDARIPVLLLEGSPHWDTTFLKRTLSVNERIEFTSVMLLAKDKPIMWTNADSETEVKLPESREDFSKYPLIVCGRNLEKLFSDESLENLAAAVSEEAVTLLLARGRPEENGVLDELAPAEWNDGAAGPVRLASRSAGSLVPVGMLDQVPGGAESLPALPLVQRIEEPKTLAAVEAVVEDPDGNGTVPAMVHRRFQTGQVLAISVGGLWRWSLHESSEPTNNLYDRFWNQLLLNLFARSGATTSDRPQLLVSSANLKIGQEASFTLHPGKKELAPGPKDAAIYRDEELVGRVTLTPTEKGSWRGNYLPTEPGRYRVALPLKDEVAKCRFAVIREDREIVEVSPDYIYLQKLAELSGGQLLNADTLETTLDQLARAAVAESDAPPIVKRHSLWDKPGYFYLFFAILGLEWFLRRRWGLT